MIEDFDNHATQLNHVMWSSDGHRLRRPRSRFGKRPKHAQTFSLRLSLVAALTSKARVLGPERLMEFLNSKLPGINTLWHNDEKQ